VDTSRIGVQPRDTRACLQPGCPGLTLHVAAWLCAGWCADRPGWRRLGFYRRRSIVCAHGSRSLDELLVGKLVQDAGAIVPAAHAFHEIDDMLRIRSGIGERASGRQGLDGAVYHA
jgi:hypothetical protein